MTRLSSSSIVVGVALLAGCAGGGSGGGDGPAASGSPQAAPLPGDQPGVPPGQGFASDVVLFSVAQAADGAVSAYSVNEASSQIGTLPGSPLDLGGQLGPDAAVAVDASARRAFVAADTLNAVAVVDLDNEGQARQVAGSPFATERAAPSAVEVGEGGSVLYVGYHSSATISQYAVNASTGALTAMASPAAMRRGNAKALLRVGRILFAASYESRAVSIFSIDEVGALTAAGEVVTSSRPIDLAASADGQLLYVSLCNCDGGDGAVDAFTIDATNKVLIRLPGSPFRFPGIENYQRLALKPDGSQLAVAVHIPPSIAVFDIEATGALKPREQRRLHQGSSGPQGLAWTPDGRYLYLADNRTDGADQGIYVFESAGGALVDVQLAPARYAVGGAPLGLAIGRIAVAP